MKESQNGPEESLQGPEESREETFDEFLRRLHCSQQSTDEIIESLYDARKELRKSDTKIRALENRLNVDSQTLHIECLKETLKLREKLIIRLLATSTKVLGEWINLLPKRVRYRHDTELIDEAEEVINYTTRLTATLVNNESNESAGLDEKREQS